MKIDSKDIKSALKLLDIKKLNPMQEEAISKFKSNNNLLLLSPTGSGKTLAFLIPILTNLDVTKTEIQKLIIVPSRELAIQIENVVRSLKLGVRVNSVYGGHSFTSERNSMINPPAILIGTPGRLKDHLGKETVDVSNVDTLILDEFDKSLEFGFLDEISSIHFYLKNLERHFFTSATKAIEIPDFIKAKDVCEVSYLDKKSEAPRFKYFQIASEVDEKSESLLKLISSLPPKERIIIFCNHRDAVERLGEHFNDYGFVSEVYHGGLEQRDRERSLIKFNNGSANILISTDLGARGLDIADVNHIVHYQNATTKESYIHRNGRASRLNSNGRIYSFSPIPDIIEDIFEKLRLQKEIMVSERPEFETLFISKGKKDKVNKIDIVGFLYQSGKLKSEEIGKIDVKDKFAYVAINANKFDQLLGRIRDMKLKNKSVKFKKSN